MQNDDSHVLGFNFDGERFAEQYRVSTPDELRRRLEARLAEGDFCEVWLDRETPHEAMMLVNNRHGRAAVWLAGGPPACAPDFSEYAPWVQAVAGEYRVEYEDGQEYEYGDGDDDDDETRNDSILVWFELGTGEPRELPAEITVPVGQAVDALAYFLEHRTPAPFLRWGTG